jgi:hypothetical protein
VQYAITPRYTMGAVERQLGHAAEDSGAMDGVKLRTPSRASTPWYAFLVEREQAEAAAWVVLRHYDDGLAAQIALDFLRDHGIPVGLRGNSGSTAVLNRFDTVLDVRLIVRAKHRLRALEALHALEEPGTPIETREELVPCSGHPYRDTTSRDLAPMPRYKRAAFALALMLPIGSGHFYAGENVAGCVFASAIALLSVSALALRAESFFIAAMLVVASDATLALSAVERHNDSRHASPATQALRACACVAAALLVSRFV